MQVMIRSRVFETVAEAAAAFGVTPQAIYTSRHRGTLDRVGLPPEPHGGRPPVPIKLHGMEWPSYAQAARCLKYKESTLRDAILEGGPVAKARLKTAVEDYRERLLQRGRVPCKTQGTQATE